MIDNKQLKLTVCTKVTNKTLERNIWPCGSNISQLKRYDTGKINWKNQKKKYAMIILYGYCLSLYLLCLYQLL